jgi:hypothetical protein
MDAADEGNRVDAVLGPNKTGSVLKKSRLEVLSLHLERLVDLSVHVDDGITRHLSLQPIPPRERSDLVE